MTFLRRLAEYEPDDTDEKLTGMQPDTLDELRAERLARQDREDDHAPHTSTQPDQSDWRLHAQMNLSRGWCPCGEETDDQCECFGVDRLAIAQGKSPPNIVRDRDAFGQERS